MDDITSQEALSVLERLVRERKALDKGVAVLAALASAEQLTKERQKEIDTLNVSIVDLQAKGQETSRALATAQIEQEAIMRKFDRDAEQAIEQKAKLLKDLQRQIGATQAQLEVDALNAQAVHDANMLALNEEHAAVVKSVEEAKAQLAAIQDAARAIVGA